MALNVRTRVSKRHTVWGRYIAMRLWQNSTPPEGGQIADMLIYLEKTPLDVIEKLLSDYDDQNPQNQPMGVVEGSTEGASITDTLSVQDAVDSQIGDAPWNDQERKYG